MAENPFVGSWTYRSLLNDPDPGKAFDDLAFGRGTLVIDEAPDAVRTVPHPGGGGRPAPAGFVASFYAVRAD